MRADILNKDSFDLSAYQSSTRLVPVAMCDSEHCGEPVRATKGNQIVRYRMVEIPEAKRNDTHCPRCRRALFWRMIKN